MHMCYFVQYGQLDYAQKGLVKGNVNRTHAAMNPYLLSQSHYSFHTLQTAVAIMEACSVMVVQKARNSQAHVHGKARTTCLYNVNLWRSSEDYKHNFLCINLIKKNNNLD